MKYIILLGALMCTSFLFSQKQGTIKGNVIDLEMNNEPFLFANVSIKDTQKRARTNFHGNFEIIDIEEGNYTLVISFAGHETLEMPVEVKKNKITKINGALMAKTIGLDQLANLDEVSRK